MAKRGKKYQEALKLVDRFNKYSIDEAISLKFTSVMLLYAPATSITGSPFALSCFVLQPNNIADRAKAKRLFLQKVFIFGMFKKLNSSYLLRSISLRFSILFFSRKS